MFRLRCSFGLLSAATLLACFTSLDCSAQDSVASTAQSKPLPLLSPSVTTYQRYDTYREAAQQQIRERVQFEARQRVLRAEWNEWIGYNPSRPTVNASYLSNGLQSYYVPARGQIVNNGMGRSWYW